MKRASYPLLVSMLFLCLSISDSMGQTVDLAVNSSAVPKASFIGGSTEFMYPILRGTPNEDTTVYDTIYISDQVIEELKDLNLNYLRFPGGTISQYYHFAGSHGYGTIDFDLNCRPDFIDIPGFKQKVRVDKAYPGNMIEQYIDLHKWLEAEQGNSIQSLYVINIMSHFFSGDFIPVNPVIDGLIDSYGEDLGAFLELGPHFLNDELVDAAVVVMLQIVNDPLIDQIKSFLVNEEGFQLRMAENIAGINKLITDSIPIAGIELGNENYAFTMLKDDDLSGIPFDCTSPDSLVLANLPIKLSLKTYMQAIIKYGIITSMYDALVDELFNLPTGIVVNSTEFNVDLVDPAIIDEFEINEVKTEKYRYHEIWNKFMGQLDFYDGVIPHIYMKSQPECFLHDTLTVSELETYGKAYVDYYFDEILDYQLNRILAETNNKPLWITEWNMNTANLFGNTFLHGSYVYQFMNELNRSHEDYNIEMINFHNLAAWRYNQFALLRTDEDTTGYQVNLQSVYDPYLIMGEIHRDGLVVADCDMPTWLGDDFKEPPLHYYYSYFDTQDTALILNFINQSGSPVEIPVSGTKIILSVDGAADVELMVEDFNMDFIDAESILSSNEGCSEHPELYDNYQLLVDTGDKAFAEIPGYSLGRIVFSLDLATAIQEHRQINFNIHPNPSAGSFTLDHSFTGAGLELSIFDLRGSLYKTQNIVNGQSIDVSHLADGVYYIRLNVPGESTSGIRKLVVSNHHE